MTILFICSEYPPFLTGGIGTFVKNISEQLINNKHHSIVVGMYPIKENMVEEIKGVMVHRLALPQMKTFPRSISKLVNGILSKYKLSKYIQKLEQTEQIDLIESYEWSGPLYNKPKTKLLIRLHGSHTAHAITEGKRKSVFISFWEKKNLAMADAVLSVSKYMETITETTFGAITKPKRIVYNGINLETFSYEDANKRNKNQILFVGKFHERKGVYELFRIVNELFKLNVGYCLQFVGQHTADQKSELLDILKSEFIDRVKFVNAVDQVTLSKMYQISTLMIMPTRAEAFGLTAAEAMACGCLVAMNTLPVAAEIIDNGINGILINANENEKSAIAIHQLLSDTEKMNCMRAAARKKVEGCFSNEIVFQQNIDFYNQMLAAT